MVQDTNSGRVINWKYSGCLESLPLLFLWNCGLNWCVTKFFIINPIGIHALNQLKPCGYVYLFVCLFYLHEVCEYLHFFLSKPMETVFLIVWELWEFH